MVPAVTRREHDTAGPMHSPSAFSYGQANLRLLTLASIFITTTTTIWQHIMMMWLVDQRPSRAHVPVAHPPYWPSILPLRPVIAKPEHQFRLWNLQIENVRSNIVLPDYCDHKHWPYSQTRCACALSSYNRKWQPSWMLVMHYGDHFHFLIFKSHYSNPIAMWKGEDNTKFWSIWISEHNNEDDNEWMLSRKLQENYKFKTKNLICAYTTLEPWNWKNFSGLFRFWKIALLCRLFV